MPAGKDRWSAPELMVDGVRYLNVNPKRVPIGHAEVELHLDDNGEKILGLMTAGSIGTSVKDTKTDAGGIVRDGEVSPISAWWMYIPGDKTPQAQVAGW
jgi:hypothetical protein